MTTLLKGIRKEDGASVEVEYDGLFVPQSLFLRLNSFGKEIRGSFSGDIKRDGSGRTFGFLFMPPYYVAHSDPVFNFQSLGMNFKAKGITAGKLFDLYAEVHIMDAAGNNVAKTTKTFGSAVTEENGLLTLTPEFSDIEWIIQEEPAGVSINEEDFTVIAEVDRAYSILINAAVNID